MLARVYNKMLYWSHINYYQIASYQLHKYNNLLNKPSFNRQFKPRKKIFKMYGCSTVIIPSNKKKHIDNTKKLILNGTLLQAIDTRHSSFPYRSLI